MKTSHAGRPALQPSRGSPAAAGFRMPAEWERHRATWLVWPHNREDWDVKMPAAEWCYVEIVRLLLDGEAVSILFQDRTVERRACSKLRQAGVDPDRVERYRVATNRSWIRDSGPLFLAREVRARRTQVAISDWRFNGWARYRAWQRDNLVPRRIARRIDMERFDVTHAAGSAARPVVLEGGSIDVDGRGLLLTTEECLLGAVQARNPQLGRDDIEQVLCDYLNVRRVLWLGQGIVGDDTHGHVDGVARFVADGVVVAATEPDPSDENHERLADNLARLERMTTLDGAPLRIVELPMPSPVCFGGERLPASYANFYIGNRRVLVPTFNDARDRIALDRLAPLFPGREVVGVHAVDLVLGLGTLHCVTQQEPAGPEQGWTMPGVASGS